MSRRHVHIIGAVAIMAIGCDRPPRASVQGGSSAVRSPAESPPATIEAQGSFAYSDSSGTQLLALDSLPDPSAIRAAICSGGITLPVRYDRRQHAQPNGNGRQVASNFRNERGDVFRVLGGKVPASQTCYLARDSALLANARPATMHEPSDCSAAQVSLLAAAKQRQVVHCWRIATPAHLEVLAVQFANIDSSALASLAVVGDRSPLFKDFPAVYHGPGESLWRVDDEGVFSPKDFDILFIAASPSGYVMALAWAGAEGESSELLLAAPTGAFRTVTKGYRYWAPT